MSLFDLLSDLGRRASQAVLEVTPSVDNAQSKVPAELPIVKAGKPEFGDFQISACLQLGKALGRPPRELAQAVAAALSSHEALSKVEVAGPGFVNLHLRDDVLSRRTASLARDARLGLRQIGAGQRVVIDFSSPNVAKPMHIGHIRSTIIGGALDRTLRALGYDVLADNHIGDWGTQFGKLIVAWKRWLDADAYAREPIKELERLYQRFGAEEKLEKEALGLAARKDEDDEEEAPAAGRVAPILVEARAELVKLQKGDPEIRALWQRFVDDSRHVFDEIYRRLDIRFDHWLGESAYNAMLPGVVEDLVARGIAVESQGAIVVPSGETRGDRPLVFIVQKADGGFNYATTDVATMAVRTGVPAYPNPPAGPFNASWVIIVTDDRQGDHFKQLFAIARKLGVTAQLDHVSFGLMRFWNEETKSWEAGSTRKGNVIHLEDLLDEAERRAALVAKDKAAERETTLGGEELRTVARVVGIGAVKYNDLSKDRSTLVSFTWEKALALTGNTAPYLQYAYARIRSILRKSDGGVDEDAAIVFTSPVERELAKKLLAYPEAVEQVARSLRPHVLCDYLYDLSTAFSTFYADHPVLKAEPEVRASRLLLTELCARTLAAGLALLGIEVLDRM